LQLQLKLDLQLLESCGSANCNTAVAATALVVVGPVDRPLS